MSHGLSDASTAVADLPPTESGGAAGDHREEQRRRIVEAAATCFARDGFHGTSMQRICAEAGMSPGALYRYFRSKEELIAALVTGERAERSAMFDVIRTAPSVIGGLFACLAEYLGKDDACARLSPEITAEAIRNEALRIAMAPAEDEMRAELEQALARGVAIGEIAPEHDLSDVLVMLQAIGDGLFLHQQLNPQWDIARRLPAFEVMIRQMLGPHLATSPARPDREV